MSSGEEDWLEEVEEEEEGAAAPSPAPASPSTPRSPSPAASTTPSVGAAPVVPVVSPPTGPAGNTRSRARAERAQRQAVRRARTESADTDNEEEEDVVVGEEEEEEEEAPSPPKKMKRRRRLTKEALLRCYLPGVATVVNVGRRQNPFRQEDLVTDVGREIEEEDSNAFMVLLSLADAAAAEGTDKKKEERREVLGLWLQRIQQVYPHLLEFTMVQKVVEDHIVGGDDLWQGSLDDFRRGVHGPRRSSQVDLSPVRRHHDGVDDVRAGPPSPAVDDMLEFDPIWPVGGLDMTREARAPQEERREGEEADDDDDDQMMERRLEGAMRRREEDLDEEEEWNGAVVNVVDDTEGGEGRAQEDLDQEREDERWREEEASPFEDAFIEEEEEEVGNNEPTVESEGSRDSAVEVSDVADQAPEAVEHLENDGAGAPMMVEVEEIEQPKKKVFVLFGAQPTRNGRVDAGELAWIARWYCLPVAEADVGEIRVCGSRVLGGQTSLVFFNVRSKQKERQLEATVRSGTVQSSLKQTARAVCTLDMCIEEAVHLKSSAILELLYEFAKPSPTVFACQGGLKFADGDHVSVVNLFEDDFIEVTRAVLSRFSRTARHSIMRTAISEQGHTDNLRALIREFNISLSV